MPRFIPKPEHIIVGHRTYTVNWLTEEEWHMNPHLDNDNRGQTDNVDGNICVRLFQGRDDGGDAAIDMLREVLLHEVMHAVSTISMVWNSWGIHSERFKDDWDGVEEVIVGGWAPPLLQVLRDNPEFVKWLQVP